MNTDRKAILKVLSALRESARLTTHEVAIACSIGDASEELSYSDAERELLALDMLGWADFSGAAWALTADGRDFVAARMAHE